MEKLNKVSLSEEHIRKIKHRSGYVINESPRYRSIDLVGEEFDEIPTLTNEAGDQEDNPLSQEKEQPREPSNMQSVEGEPPVPEFDKGSENSPNMPPIDDMGGIGDEGGMPPADPAQQVDEIQNEIIKHNIDAMKGIHSQLENLNSLVQSLDNKFNQLNVEVEEVREPSNVEKLMNKKDVSYPYYFNLNDLWSGNWFNENHKGEKEKGIRELPDGTFIADFDELPKKSKIDIQNSFNDTV